MLLRFRVFLTSHTTNTSLSLARALFLSLKYWIIMSVIPVLTYTCCPTPSPTRMDGWMKCDFFSFVSAVFQSYQNDGLLCAMAE